MTNGELIEHLKTLSSDAKVLVFIKDEPTEVTKDMVCEALDSWDGHYISFEMN